MGYTVRMCITAEPMSGSSVPDTSSVVFGNRRGGTTTSAFWCRDAAAGAWGAEAWYTPVGAHRGQHGG